VLFTRWRETVGDDDLVIIPGDISWAMRLEEALPDLQALAQLPGVKVLIRGNHDYWWPSISRLRAALPPGMHALQNDAFVYQGIAVAGTRGWITPFDREFTEHDEKIYRREAERLRLSLTDAKKKPHDHLIIALHYPPFGPGGEPTLFTELIEEARPDAVVFGHLHTAIPEKLPRGWKGIPLHLVAADVIGFRPRLILETDKGKTAR
jgi:predicted phosphohydrolase